MRYNVEIFFRSNTIAGNNEGLGTTINIDEDPEGIENFFLSALTGNGVIPLSRPEELLLVPAGDIKYIRVKYRMPVEQTFVAEETEFIVEGEPRPKVPGSMEDIEYGK